MDTFTSPQATPDFRPMQNDISTFTEKSPNQCQINQAWRREESICVTDLLQQYDISEQMSEQIYKLAFDLSHSLREQKNATGKAGLVQGLLQEFSLSSQEGIALMCLAEALLRIPDTATRDLLIRDKINQGHWKEHVGQSQLIFVNAAAWGLMLTGKLMQTPQQKSLSSLLTGLIERSGRGIIRKAVDVAMRMMGEQFVTGENIDEALLNAKRLESKGFRYSYDMLGEAALTDADAERYYQDYLNAIHAIGKASADKDVYAGPGISIKLSALHPRYQRAQIDRVHAELYPKVLHLAQLAKQYDIGLNIDAEETERLEISLELLERLCFEDSLAEWKGIGFVIQAYQKRCVYVVDYLVDLATRSQKRLMIRLVKGAYWDSEIKKAQIDGMSDYPVFSRKVHTDLSYLVCAKKLLAAPEQIYPQFATHNAQSLASIYHMAGGDNFYPGQYEFQCLHGMGEPLYAQVVGSKDLNKLGIPCRIYAPVGNHETLLAYLVRRLLENGANSSFVNRIADKSLEIKDLIKDPQAEIRATAVKEHAIGLAHPSIVLPQDLYQPTRTNSQGFDLNNDADLSSLNAAAQQYSDVQWHASALGRGLDQLNYPAAQPILNPALNRDIVGSVIESTPAQIEMALENAESASLTWQQMPKAQRAACLQRAAKLMHEQQLELMLLLCRESGKTFANAISELREAIDFLNYYAAQAIDLDENANLQALGPVLCISPWNFPLAIFSGQIAAALVAGNPVIAKPAEQTPLVAAKAVQIFWQAGIPDQVLQLLPGAGETVGATLCQDPRIQGIMFTGSTEVAKILQLTLAKRLSLSGQPIPLIAETGGQNALIVDSSALTEQAVLDIVSSAYDSAGQRCSALRILCLQQDNAAAVIHMLKGAMQQLKLGQPFYLETDVGPVIDAEAQNNIRKHIDKMRAKGYPVHQLMLNTETHDLDLGTFVVPTLIELPDLDDLEREVFGPVLHVITYKQGQLNTLLDAINAKGYGLTMGLHTRIDENIKTVMNHSEVGNLYINRNIVGAVVGVQPFGGEGLSGTGPKAGGPLYLYRLMQHGAQAKLNPPFGVKAIADTNTQPNHVDSNVAMQLKPTVQQQFQAWVALRYPELQLTQLPTLEIAPSYELAGPTGERNLYALCPRARILCLAEQSTDLLQQLNVVWGIGSQAAIYAEDAQALQLLSNLPLELAQQLHVVNDLIHDSFDVVLHHGSVQSLQKLQLEMAARSGAIVAITHLESSDTAIPIARLLIERATSINTAAAGGNASLMSLA
ncbi:L-proline dehydrogenase /delta-1-pyrroline-5-carboxylate dehydrogenase [Acinetobacter calcoaceticus]|uniref:Bifunctional protein PutA n=1 Tax=Acinetobacter calcoaceticus TaxID=471 RepID=A0A4V2R1G6_ACICA|nr:L-proline dehydrogenase /delta-1-pyrroline-5-carboxylate dehydrogenase [Acinetobacter calcoaceticus]